MPSVPVLAGRVLAVNAMIRRIVPRRDVVEFGIGVTPDQFLADGARVRIEDGIHLNLVGQAWRATQALRTLLRG